MDQESIYIGNRYVPKLVGEWNQLKEYEGLSIVTINGNSYTSKKRVPEGIPISNEDYWVKTGDYNAQVEEFKNDFTAQLTQKADESQLPQVLKYLYMENEVDSQMSMIDLKNFGRTNKRIPFVIHNYTDARLMQLDNVGSNTNLQLTNAYNPTNRPDKDGNYVGTGVFIDLQEYQLATATNVSVLKLTNTGGLDWSGLKGGTVFTNGKEVSTDYLYEFRSKKAHANLFRFGNASRYVLSFLNDMPVDSIPTRTAIESSDHQTNGMLIQTRAGSLNLKSFNGKTVNTGSLDVTDKLVVTNDISVGKNLQIGRTTDVDALPNSVYLDEGSTLKYKNSAGVVKTIAFSA